MAKNQNQNDRYFNIRGDHTYADSAFQHSLLDFYDCMHKVYSPEVPIIIPMPVEGGGAAHKLFATDLLEIYNVVQVRDPVHKVKSTELEGRLTIGLDSVIHKVRSNDIPIELYLSVYGGAIHRHEATLERKALINPVCDRYLNSYNDWQDRWLDTPYESRYLETPYEENCAGTPVLRLTEESKI